MERPRQGIPLGEVATSRVSHCPLPKIDPSGEHERRAAAGGVRTERGRPAADLALEAVRQAAGSRSDMMPPILDAVRARATEGEVVRAMRAVFGSYREAAVF